MAINEQEPETHWPKPAKDGTFYVNKVCKFFSPQDMYNIYAQNLPLNQQLQTMDNGTNKFNNYNIFMCV